MPRSTCRAKGEARKGDHRVAAPVAEPVVAGDDRRSGSVSGGPGHEELVGGQNEPFRDVVGAVCRLENRTLVGPPSFQRRVGVEVRVRVGCCDDHRRRTGCQQGREVCGEQVVVDVVETPKRFDFQEGSLIPAIPDGHVEVANKKEERQGAPVHPDAAVKPTGAKIEVADPGRCMMVAGVHERGNAQPDRMAAFCVAIHDIGRVGAGFHPRDLLECGTVDVEPPGGDGHIESECAGSLMRNIRERETVDGFRGPREEQRASDGGLERCDEQPVVSAGQRSLDRARRVAADAVGDEPLHDSEPRVRWLLWMPRAVWVRCPG
jgi:hypothetical protein